MNRIYHFFIAVILITTFWLSGCQTTARRPAAIAATENQAYAAQSAREAMFEQQARWGFSGRVAVTTANDSGNASVDWQADGDAVDIKLSAPVTRKTWRLIGDGQQYRIEGIDSGTLTGDDPEQLVKQATGWTIPIRAMSHWVRGLRAPGSAKILFDAQGMPTQLQQQQWQVDYRDWFSDEPIRPRRVFAENRAINAKVRLIVEQWNENGEQ